MDKSWVMTVDQGFTGGSFLTQMIGGMLTRHSSKRSARRYWWIVHTFERLMFCLRPEISEYLGIYF